ncbi:MAG: hypothetical protein KAT71_04310 [Gammaproteobacteria bacterium]|nr:hypothetical protein [Gammaproteobacteria bacterium]
MIVIREIVDSIFSLGLFINAILFVPQIIALYSAKKSCNFSALTFVGFNVIQLSFILHGLVIHDYLLAAGYLLSLITCGVVTVLIFYYRYIKQ